MVDLLVRVVVYLLQSCLPIQRFNFHTATSRCLQQVCEYCGNSHFLLVECILCCVEISLSFMSIFGVLLLYNQANTI